MSNFRFLIFVSAFAAFLWFVFKYEPEPDRIYVSPQSETVEQQNEEGQEIRSPDEIRAMQTERLRSAGRGLR